MAGFLTDGREALIAALKADVTIDGAITPDGWRTFESGLWERVVIDPARCPMCWISPAEAELAQLTNYGVEIPQIIEVDFATEGQDASTMETLLAAFYDVLIAARGDMLDLSGDGLYKIDWTGSTWVARPSKEGARLIWLTTTRVRLHWRLRRPLTS